MQADALANSLTGVQAKYAVQVDADGLAGGFELIAGGKRVDFGVRANTFSIAAPAGSGIAPAVPFIVQATATEIGGVAIPRGVYMDSAFIQNASITNAKIGGDIWSSNYVAGSSGWYLYRSGDMEINNLRARGYITGGAFTNVNWPAAGAGFYLGPEVLRMGNYTSGRFFEVSSNGNVIAPGFTIIDGNPTFAGRLSGATGSFSGTLTAASVIAGRGQNADNSTFIDFNATGEMPFISAGGGKVRITADGKGDFARTILSAPDLVKSGFMAINIGEVGWVGGRHKPFTVYIETGEPFDSTWYDVPSNVYGANATISRGVTVVMPGCNGYSESTIVVGDGLNNGGQLTPIDNQIYIRFTWTPVSGTGQIRPTEIAWKLVKL